MWKSPDIELNLLLSLLSNSVAQATLMFWHFNQ